MNGRNDARKAADSVAVPGSGRRPTMVLILGEAPGRDEVRVRKPFVGTAGETLWKHVRNELGLERDDVYVTNAVKVRPVDEKGDRRPTMPEIESWRADLMDELDLAQPHVILALGVSALKALGCLPDWRMQGEVSCPGAEFPSSRRSIPDTCCADRRRSSQCFGRT